MTLLRYFCGAILLTAVAMQSSAFADEYGGKKQPAKVVWVAVYLDEKSTDAKPAARGYTPAQAKVHVGDHIVFFNIDDEVHTATLRLAGAFPPGAMKPMGHNISDVWSTGDLKANGESSPILVDKAGTYTYGCIHHFSVGQQGTIVAEP